MRLVIETETASVSTRSLTVVLVATIFGITSVSGAVLGAFFFVVLPELLRELVG